MRQEIEIMRVLRVPPLGKLVVEVSGQRFQALAEVKHAKAEQRLLAAIGELITFAGGYQVLVDAGVAPPAQPAKSAPPPPEEAASEAEKLTQRQARFLSQLEAQRDALRRQQPPPQPTILTSPTPAAIPPRLASGATMADQIDAILQKHLAEDPEMAARTIRVRENPAGGLRIEIDGHFYDRPREIPELAIQRLIKKALQEWEAG